MAESSNVTSFSSQPRIWVLADDRPGNVNQSLGVAEQLSPFFETKTIKYSPLARLPNVLLGASRLGMNTRASFPLREPWPDILIAAGRRSAPIARWVKKKSGGRTFLTHMMWPDAGSSDFNLIVVPEHDQRPKTWNLMTTIGTPNRITPQLLEEEAAQWRYRLQETLLDKLPHPQIAVLIGGSSKRNQLTNQDAAELGRKLAQLCRNSGGGLMVTSSRRTPPLARDMLVQTLEEEKVPFYFHGYQPGADNPYLGFLGIADATVVTGDSMSMCSEACSTGKPVYIFSTERLASDKHRRLHESLYGHGFARPLTGQYEKWFYEPLQEAKKVADEIRKRAAMTGRKFETLAA